MKYFHGAARQGPYFEGWYLKFRTAEGKTLALIPALHIDGEGRCSASLQVVSAGGAWWLDYPASALHAAERTFRVRLGENRFSDQGVWLNVEREGLSLHGALRCGPFTSLKSDIMGPFRFLPMECAHGVISMGHTLEGELTLNGETLDFSGGRGYIETDRGRSFPGAYLWTQCAWEGGGLMLSIASIPLAGLEFTGCICAVCHGGREYRLATYRGVRVERWSASGAEIRQGKYRLTVEFPAGQGLPLRAPAGGVMDRTIRETLCASVRCRFWAGETLLFDCTDPCASFEYAAED